MRGTKPEWQTKIAKERIGILFEEAAKTVLTEPKLSNRYVSLARRIGMRYNVRIPVELKRKICRGCKAYLHSGVTAKHSTKAGVLRIECKSCKRINRYPFGRK